ncbi:hypothetical protein CXF68_18075 [Tenacibaculum sp. Bg11-29]|uniref:hypothetical protein n=1 Tax=Tenacibaculum sp. Bg11-29 TaxID=2058306 RepID=UPI000C344701|nr:hypothetical protein [Tenacibaculum sp. Bg11-29]PKH52485.1 hypothetical protein CXF68_18075 [Tenacibaculum sp. Bg11-29]
MKTLKTIKYTLIITLLILLTTGCTDLTEDLVPETKAQNTELISGGLNTTNNLDTGGDGNGSDTNGGKGN